MLLAEATNAVGLCLTVVRLLVTHLPFNPIELFEEPESLSRRSATLLSCLNGFDKRRLEWAMHPV